MSQPHPTMQFHCRVDPASLTSWNWNPLKQVERLNHVSHRKRLRWPLLAQLLRVPSPKTRPPKPKIRCATLGAESCNPKRENLQYLGLCKMRWNPLSELKFGDGELSYGKFESKACEEVAGTEMECQAARQRWKGKPGRTECLN